MPSCVLLGDEVARGIYQNTNSNPWLGNMQSRFALPYSYQESDHVHAKKYCGSYSEFNERRYERNSGEGRYEDVSDAQYFVISLGNYQDYDVDERYSRSDERYYEGYNAREELTEIRQKIGRYDRYGRNRYVIWLLPQREYRNRVFSTITSIAENYGDAAWDMSYLIMGWPSSYYANYAYSGYYYASRLKSYTYYTADWRPSTQGYQYLAYLIYAWTGGFNGNCPYYAMNYSSPTGYYRGWNTNW